MRLDKLDRILNGIKDVKHYRLTLKPNYMLIPITRIEACEESAKIFNALLNECRKQKLNNIVRTPSGGISYKKGNLRLPCYGYTHTQHMVELTICSTNGWYRIQFRGKMEVDKNEKVISGRKAWIAFVKLLEKEGINIKDYAVENGKEVNAQTEKYIIDVERPSFLNKTFNNCHHIDFHSSFPAGLVNTHPEFKDVITKIYNKRKTNETAKAILNYSIGFMHSSLVGWKYSTLSRDAINDNNRRLREMKQKLIKSGRIPILYNTDGIWYSGPIYHGKNEGDGLGEWRNDHINCTLRVKSKGAYEFIEDGKYTPVIRGATKLDRIKDRSEWEWGDIFKNEAEIITFVIDDNGIHYEGENI